MIQEQFITLETAHLAMLAGFMDEFELKLHRYPTQSVLQKWLREEKGYHIIIIHTYKVINSQNISIWGVLVENMLLSLNTQNIQQLYDNLGNALAFYTFEEAVEAGLQKCLKEITKK